MNKWNEWISYDSYIFLPLVISPCLSASLSYLPSLYWPLSFSPDWPHPASSYISSLHVSQPLSHLPSLQWLPSFSPDWPPLACSYLSSSPCLSASLSHLPSLHWLLSLSPVWPHPACSYLSSSSLLYMPLSLSITSSFSSLITLILPRLASTPLLIFLPLVFS